MSASSRAPPSEMRTYLRPIARAIDFAIDVLPTPGGPAKSRMRPRALADLLVSSLMAPGWGSPSTVPAFSAFFSACSFSDCLPAACESCRTARNSRMRSLTSFRPKWSSSRMRAASGTSSFSSVRVFHGSSAIVSRYVRMTCDSIDSRPMRARRFHSRSASLRASSGRSSASSFALSSFSPSSVAPSPSPSSFWMALSCSRRYISRCRLPISSLTLDWMSSCAESTSI